jgi:hypothetical protein
VHEGQGLADFIAEDERLVGLVLFVRVDPEP